MASNPTFVASIATLQKKLRLTNLPTGLDGAAIFDEAILRARTSFFRRLGVARITTLQALAFTENPTTENDHIRALANVTEVMLVRSHLMQSMPSLFIDGSGLGQVWNEEAPFRDRSAFELSKERQDLEAEIEENMQLLDLSETATNETTIQASSIEPTTKPDFPFASIFPSQRNS